MSNARTLRLFAALMTVAALSACSDATTAPEASSAASRPAFATGDCTETQGWTRDCSKVTSGTTSSITSGVAKDTTSTK